MSEKTIKNETKKDLVKITLFKDNEKYKDDVTVVLNGKFYTIKRGVEVEVPLGVVEIINNANKQEQIAIKNMEASAYKE